MTTIYSGIAELLTFSGAVKKNGRHPTEEDLGIVHDGAFIVSTGGKIVWAGARRDARKALKSLGLRGPTREKKLNAPAVMPAFVDCHTHLVFAGDRAHEFELRNQGVTYQQIAAQGGGIRFTVKQTREATGAQLLRLAQARLSRLCAQGVATVEIKSGYGLSERHETRILEVVKKLRATTAARIVATYLGPHAIPPDESGQPQSSEKLKSDYWNEILTSTLPAIKKRRLADRVDIFVEENYFSPGEAQDYAARARALGFGITAHAEQLTRTGASRDLAKFGAQSVDHCVQITDEDIDAISKTETVCVLLPASDFYLKMKYPPARSLIQAGTRVALATDYNPGTSPTLDLSLVGVLARLEMGMSQAEVMTALTFNPASALGLTGVTGALQPGYSADFAVLADDWRRLFYEVGYHPIAATYCRGYLVKL